jgi:Protein of unknown function (DUF3313)
MTILKSAKFRVALLCGAALLVAAGAVMAADSGFLPDYSQLQKVKDLNGNPIRQWISPNLTKANYQKILLEKVTFYPEPKGSDQVSDKTLSDIEGYLDWQLRTVGFAGLPMVSDPGPGVMRVKVAITAVDTSATGLKPWQIIPVALVMQGARAATGNRAENSNLAVEAIASDSVTGAPLAMSVREARGATLPNSKAQLTLETVKPAIDSWAKGVASLVQKRLEQQ